MEEKLTSHCSVCGPLLDIQPLVDRPEGRYINPLADILKVYTLTTTPNVVTLPPGQSQEISLTAQAEENHYGDLLVGNLRASVTPAQTGRFSVQMQSQQNDRSFMNNPVLDRFVFTNSQLDNNLQCCFLIQATNFVQITVQNLDTVNPLTLQITAQGRRFLPYQYPGFRDQLLSYWNAQKTIPFWLTFDRVIGSATTFPVAGSGVIVGGSAAATAFMTVPGAGDFRYIEPLCLTIDTNTGALVDSDDILIRVSEGIGRAIMSEPIPMGSHFAQPTAFIAGLQGAEYRPAAGNHAKPRFWQYFKRNTRIRVDLTNTNANARTVFLAFKGCMDYYDECEPGYGMSQARSLEETIGPMLVQAPRCPPVQAFEPAPGQGLVPINAQSAIRIVPPTGFTPPVPLPDTGQQLSYPAQQIQAESAMQQMQGMGNLQPGQIYYDPRTGQYHRVIQTHRRNGGEFADGGRY